MQSDILIELWFGNPYHQAHVKKYKKKTITRWLIISIQLIQWKAPCSMVGLRWNVYERDVEKKSM